MKDRSTFTYTQASAHIRQCQLKLGCFNCNILNTILISTFLPVASLPGKLQKMHDSSKYKVFLCFALLKHKLLKYGHQLELLCKYKNIETCQQHTLIKFALQNDPFEKFNCWNLQQCIANCLCSAFTFAGNHHSEMPNCFVERGGSTRIFLVGRG